MLIYIAAPHNSKLFLLNSFFAQSGEAIKWLNGKELIVIGLKGASFINIKRNVNHCVHDP